VRDREPRSLESRSADKMRLVDRSSRAVQAAVEDGSAVRQHGHTTDELTSPKRRGPTEGHRM